MTDEATAIALPLHSRVRAGMRHVHNWTQLLRFMAVGASGYAVNLAVFAAVHDWAGGDYRLAALVAWLVGLANNFAWNRQWTFDAQAGHAGFQAARFVAVSAAAFVVSFFVLQLLVLTAGMAELPAQAIAILIATPVNFLGNKLWSFAG
jgi:putative flippase GtrA